MASVFESIEPAQLPDGALEELAELAKIKISQKAFFNLHLPPMFIWARDWHGYDLRAPKRQAIHEKLAKVEKAASRLLTELNTLDEGAARELGLSALRCSLFGNTDSQAAYNHQKLDLLQVANGRARGRELLESYRKATDAIRLGAQSYPFRLAKRAGTPTKSPSVPYNPNTTAADSFIIEVFKLVHHCGGHLTVDKNATTGTAVEFFNLASRHLPSTFRLRGFSASRLQYLRGHATGRKPSQK